MARQYSTTLRNALLNQYETTIGTAPKLRILTGSAPANCAAAQTGILLCEITLPSNWLGTASGGTISKSGTWEGTVTNSGTAGYYRMVGTSGSPTEAHEQGSITQAFALNTSAPTPANQNSLTFASTSGVIPGATISGTGIQAGTTVLAVTSTQVLMSTPSISGVSSGAQIFFGDTSGDLFLSATALTVGQTLTINTRSLTAPGA